MTHGVTCDRCHQPVHDNAHLCRGCGDKLAKLIGDIPALVTDLIVTYTRQSRSERLVGRSATSPLFWSEPARRALDHLHATLVAWVRLIVAERGLEHWPVNVPSAMSGWLLHHIDWIRHHPAATQAFDEIRAAVRDLERVMDTHNERWYAGPCRAEYTTHPDTDDVDACCLVDLYAKPNAPTVECRNCHTIHDVPSRREWLLNAAEDQLAHAELIGRALASMGEAVTPAMVRGYALRKRIIGHGLDRQGRELFRVGDVIEVVRQIEVERSRRDALKAAKLTRKATRKAAAT